ncbi:MAG: hypothetical protein K2G51_02845, partial [Lachnospiraceae bacterium]|nr:hypothetical protein [Lachnospiraceae bacterium]
RTAHSAICPTRYLLKMKRLQRKYHTCPADCRAGRLYASRNSVLSAKGEAIPAPVSADASIYLLDSIGGTTGFQVRLGVKAV